MRERIDQFATEHGYIRSGFLTRAAKQAMEADARRKKLEAA
jgi:hypothetical protein